jgi:hypothetical protein
VRSSGTSGKTANNLPVACGAGAIHLHKACPEKGNPSSTPTCSTCNLIEGETAHPSKHRGCRYAKEEIQKRKTQKIPKNANERMFSNFITPALPFATVLPGNSVQKKNPYVRQDAVGGLIVTEISISEKQQERHRSVIQT